MRILNGRHTGGISNDFTFNGARGMSVIDYVLTPPASFPIVSKFIVCNFNEYSDHAPLHVELAVSYLYPQVENNELSTGKVREVYHWNANLAPQCREAVRVNLDKIHTSFNEAEIVSQATMNSNVDNFTSVLSGIFTPFCKSYATRSRTPDSNVHTFDVNILSRNVPDKPWFNDELKRYYREYKCALN